MKVLSLFDGISCARVALERVEIDIDAYFASEVDKYAVQIAQKNYPDTIQLGDVRHVGKYVTLGVTRNVDYVLNDIDLLIGGSPCQDLSIAKANRKGLDGERSGLFFEYVRILNEVKPKYFILENVASMPKEARQVITDTLGVEPIMIDAALVSAQRRKRLFWIGSQGPDGKYSTIPIPQPNDREIYFKNILQPESEVDEKYYLKDETLQTILKKMTDGKPLAQAFRIYDTDGKSVTLSAQGGGTGAKTGLYFITQLTETRTDEAKKIRKENMKNGRDYCSRRDKRLVPRTDGKANCLTTGQTKESLVLVINPNGTEQKKSKTLRTSGMGSGWGDKHNWDQIMVVPEATKKGYAVAHDGDAVDLLFPTSKTRRGRVGNKAKNLMTVGNAIHAFINGRVRVLTPIECERLQSLEDTYTGGVSETQRKKMLGNGFNVDVIAHILKSIFPQQSNS